MSIKTNADNLVSISVMGQITMPAQPGVPAEPYMLDDAGQPFLVPYYGGIVYNVSVGDTAYGWLADCIHPGISISAIDQVGNRALNALACVGNQAVVTSGEAKGSRGIVSGKSGRSSDQVIIHFDEFTRRKMAIGDKILVQSHGLGMALTDHQDIRLKSCSPDLLNALNLHTAASGKLAVPVAGIVPAHLLGAGIGASSDSGALNIQTTDREALKAAHLDQLRLGDLVALLDLDATWSHGYRQGAISIGIIGQGDSPRSGYGPGITVLMASSDGRIEPVLTPADANLSTLLGLSA